MAIKFISLFISLGSALALALASLNPIEASAGAYLVPLEDQSLDQSVLVLRPSASYFRSTQNFDSSGASVTPPGLVSVSQINGELHARYALLPRLTVFGAVRWTRLQLETTTLNSSSYGLGDQLVGVGYRVVSLPSGLAVDLQTQVEVPGYSNSDNVSKGLPLLGDDSTDITPAAFLKAPLGDATSGVWSATVGGGYRIRSKNGPGVIQWSGAIDLNPVTEGFALRGRVAGFHHTGATSSALSSSCGNSNGGSCISQSPRPSALLADVRIGHTLGPSALLYAQGGMPVSGNTIARGFSAGAGLEFSLGSEQSTAPEEKPTPPTPPEAAKPAEPSTTPDTGAKVIRVNDRLHLVRISAGTAQGVQVGDVWDILSVEADGKIGEVVAHTQVMQVKENEAALKITEYVKESWIEEGFAARKSPR